MANLKNTTIDDSGFFDLPSGTTSQRPSNPESGMQRFNTDLGVIELYNGNDWVPTSFSPIDASGGDSTEEITINGIVYKIHAFTSTGSNTFTVNSVGTVDTIECLIVAGGGGGGASRGGGAGGGGGGGGGLIFKTVDVSPGSYTISVGSGGSRGSPNVDERGNNGGNSSAFGETAIGGGGGARGSSGLNGGSGGGSGSQINNGGAGTSGQGNDGGATGYGGSGGDDNRGSGGGGAGDAGGGGSDNNRGGDGGAGLSFVNKFGTNYGENGDFAGGGGGGIANNDSQRRKGYGPSGGGDGSAVNGTAADNGIANTGGGGGGQAGRASGSAPGNGGSGIVLIRYPISYG